MSENTLRCIKCGGPRLAEQLYCTPCWLRWREDTIAHRERRQEQERVQAEAREQKKIVEGQ